MEATVSKSLHFTWMNSDKLVMKPSGALWFSKRIEEEQRVQIFMPGHLQHRRAKALHKPLVLKVLCASQSIPASLLESGSFPPSFDEAMILKNKSEEVEPHLNGRCLYLVGMMGSGKTTVGRILSETLGFSFFDSDSLIEQKVGASTVAEIFKLHGESFFRDNETEVLRKLSLMHRLVVSTGGGAVVRPINWKYMQKGISVWLDVPLDALARRITAVGTNSRPLLHEKSSDAYAKTLERLSALFKERGEAYDNANARVSLENIAARLGYKDVCNLSPTIIAIEALGQIEKYLEKV